MQFLELQFEGRFWDCKPCGVMRTIYIISYQYVSTIPVILVLTPANTLSLLLGLLRGKLRKSNALLALLWNIDMKPPTRTQVRQQVMKTATEKMMVMIRQSAQTLISSRNKALIKAINHSCPLRRHIKVLSFARLWRNCLKVVLVESTTKIEDFSSNFELECVFCLQIDFWSQYSLVV